MEFCDFFKASIWTTFHWQLSNLAGSFSYNNISDEMLDFQSNQYKKLVPILSHCCNGLQRVQSPCQHSHLVNMVKYSNLAITAVKHPLHLLLKETLLMQPPHLYSLWLHFWNLTLYNPLQFYPVCTAAQTNYMYVHLSIVNIHVLIKFSLLYL